MFLGQKYYNDIYFSRLYVDYHYCPSWYQECACLLMVPIVVATVFIHPTIPKSNLIQNVSGIYITIAALFGRNVLRRGELCQTRSILILLITV